MKIFYFALIREHIGQSTENVSLPSGVETVTQLITYLEEKGDNYKTAFAQSDLIRVAINDEYVGFDHNIGNDDEIAFFPPMTGG